MRITIVLVHQTISLSFPQTIFPPSPTAAHTKPTSSPRSVAVSSMMGADCCCEVITTTTVGFVGFHPITVNIDVRFCSLRDSEREEDKEAVIVL